MLRESRSPNGALNALGYPMQDPHW